MPRKKARDAIMMMYLKLLNLQDKIRERVRGATMVEYALLVIAVMVLAALAYRTLGGAVSAAAGKGTSELGQ